MSPQVEMGGLLRQERLETCDRPVDMQLLRTSLKANKILQEILRASSAQSWYLQKGAKTSETITEDLLLQGMEAPIH